jgi:hypothetical protein
MAAAAILYFFLTCAGAQTYSPPWLPADPAAAGSDLVLNLSRQEAREISATKVNPKLTASQKRFKINEIRRQTQEQRAEFVPQAPSPSSALPSALTRLQDRILTRSGARDNALVLPGAFVGE